MKTNWSLFYDMMAGVVLHYLSFCCTLVIAQAAVETHHSNVLPNYSFVVYVCAMLLEGAIPLRLVITVGALMPNYSFVVHVCAMQLKMIPALCPI